MYLRHGGTWRNKTVSSARTHATGNDRPEASGNSRDAADLVQIRGASTLEVEVPTSPLMDPVRARDPDAVVSIPEPVPSFTRAGLLSGASLSLEHTSSES